MKGADRNIADQTAKRPIDFVDAFIRDEKIKQDLRFLLVITDKLIFIGESSNILHWSVCFVLC